MASCGGASALIVVLCSVLALQGAAAAKPLVPAMFVFGDSLVDVGNNNHLAGCNASCKANYPRYGVDLPCKSPTGRFSNGYNLADRLAKLLGFAESPPPFLSLNASLIPRLGKGFNFASGGSGLRPATGEQACGCEVFTMSAQVGSFLRLVRRLESKAHRTVSDLMSKSLIFITVGSNDLFEYADNFAGANRSSAGRNDAGFLQELVTYYTSYVKILYEAGAKKFSVVSPSLVGCCPSQLKVAQDVKDVDQFGCFGLANNLSTQLYPMIASMLDGLSQELPGMSYSLSDSVGMAGSILRDHRNFTNLNHACCGWGYFGESGCNKTAPVCTDRSSYFFWDRFHPTEAASAITAQLLFVDNGTYVHPINVQQLVAQRP